MPIPGEVLSPSLHDLPIAMRAKVGRSLPVKSIAALRATSKHTFDADTVAYLGVEDRNAEIALTMRHPHLRQLVRWHRDGAEADDAALRASREALEAPETFAAACTAAEAAAPDERAVVRPLLIERVKSIASCGDRALAAAELMRTAETRHERDAIMHSFRTGLAPNRTSDQETEPFYEAAFAAADSADERGVRFAAISTPSSRTLGAYIDAVRTPQEHAHIVERYAETVGDIFSYENQVLTERLLKKDLALPLVRQLANLNTDEHIKLEIFRGLARRPIPGDVRALILGQDFVGSETLEHLARHADTPEARFAIGQSEYSSSRSTRAILFENADTLDECKQLLGSFVGLQYMDTQQAEACMAKAHTPDDVHWVVSQTLSNPRDLLRKRLLAAAPDQRSAVIARFTDADDSL